MPRQIPIVAAIILLLYPGSGIATYDPRDTAPQINNGLAAIWDSCDRLFGPAPDPRAKNWTADEKRRANDGSAQTTRDLDRRLTDGPGSNLASGREMPLVDVLIICLAVVW